MQDMRSMTNSTETIVKREGAWHGCVYAIDQANPSPSEALH